MKVNELIKYLEKRDPSGEVYIDNNQMAIDIQEVTFGKHEGKEFTVIIAEQED